ncbi:MAG TPA: DUF262 domain-containing protein [Sedimentisphaerales bacterium]|nr:DUF262 domain-containing protein [Sedimentisphaerales bacterium]
MDMSASKRAIDKIYKRRDRYEIPEWQREDVWPTKKKQMLIDTILRGWKLPKFYLLKTSMDPDEYEVVDGQQRLLAIFEFFDNELSLSRPSSQMFGADTYDDLPEHVQDDFDDFEIEYDEITNATEKEVKEFFQRLQEGLPLTSSERLNSAHSKLCDFARRLAKHDFFKKKVAVNDKRYAHFDIVAKVAAIEIEGIDTGLRYDDLKATFESQASFSSRSNVARRLKATFDYLNDIFPDKVSWLRNRTIVQSFATLVARLILTGKQTGQEAALRKFFTEFQKELSRQVTLGQRATDPDYISFQKTVNANVRRGAQIRNEIILRKLLQHNPSFADVLGVSVVAESAMAKALGEQAARLRDLIQSKNEEFARKHGTDLFKATNKTAAALTRLGTVAKDVTEYRDWLDDMYFLFRESVGTRLDGKWPDSLADVNTLRTAERHDVDHGKQRKVRTKRRQFGTVFRKYAGETTPDTLAPEKFALVQTNLLQAVESDVRALK